MLDKALDAFEIAREEDCLVEGDTQLGFCKSNVKKAYLYGSQAKCTAKPDSDIDIVLVVNKLGKHWKHKTGLEQEAEVGEAVSYHASKWKNKILDVSVSTKSPAQRSKIQMF